MSHMLSFVRISVAAACLSALPLLAVAAPASGPLPAASPAAEVAPAVAPAVTPAPATELKEVVTPAPAPRFRIGVVDIVRVGKESEEGKAIQVKLMERLDKFKAQLAAKQKQLEKQKAAIEAKLSSLLPEQRAAKGREFEKKVEAFRKQAQSGEKELMKVQEEMTTKLLKKIEQAAAAYGTKAGYAAIVVKKDLLYQSGSVESVDVTEELIGQVNGIKEGN
ncbi:MAG: OmpH family outer membrane protein [Geobacter sp.]|nr:OmpH family outer membrane protein [Geobacter sp.]